MSLISLNATCGTTATLIFACRSSVAEVFIHNHSGGAIHVGAAGVTTGSGLQINNNSTASIRIYGGDSLYAVTASGTATIDLLITAPNP